MSTKIKKIQELQKQFASLNIINPTAQHAIKGGTGIVDMEEIDGA